MEASGPLCARPNNQTPAKALRFDSNAVFRPMTRTAYMILKIIHENCSGCGTCRLACALENFSVVQPSRALLRIQGRFPAPGDYRVHFCDQCGICADNCPVEAIVLKSGVYCVDDALCTECMTCVQVCPEKVMMAPTDGPFPAKCNQCGACARICPRGAIVLDEGKTGTR
jgi:ferredoxin